jgi:hypothetical protein
VSDALRELLAAFSIEVDTAELEKGEKETDGFADKLKEFGKVVAEAFAIHEVKEFIESQIEAGAQLKVTAERLGTDTNELQAMQLAAGEAGVSVDAMSTGLRFLNRNIGEANAGSKEQAQLFAKLGISLKDASGQVRPAGDVMQDLADHIAEIPDAAEKTNVAMKLLGRGGAELIPLLNRGGEAFEEARKDLEELGGGIGTDFVEAAHKAEEANVRLSFAMKSLKSDIALVLLPDVEKLVAGFTDIVKAAFAVERQSHILEDAIGFLKAGAILFGLVKLVEGLRAFATVEGIVAALNPFNLFIAGIVIALLAYNDLKVALEGGKSVFADTFGATGIKELRADIDAAKGAADVFLESLGSIADVLSAIGDAAGYVASKFSATIKNLNAGLAQGVRALTGQSDAAQDKKEQQDVDRAQSAATDYAQRAVANASNPAKRFAAVRDSILAREDARVAVTGAVGTAGGGTSGPVYNGPPVAYSASAYGSRNQPAVPIPGREGGKEGGAGVTIHQQNTTKVEVHTSSSSPAEIGKQVGTAVATEQQRVNNNAKIAMKRP